MTGDVDHGGGDRGGGRQARRALCTEREQPLGFETDAFANECGFREVRPQWRGPLGIASIDRGERVEEVLGHAGCRLLPCRIEL